MYSLLLVEDDRLLREGLVELLTPEGYSCIACGSVEEAERQLAKQMPDLCLLDRNLPGASGEELCRSLRQQHPVMPIMMLSARGRDVDRVAGLRAGADDYMAKPFLVDELLARLAAMRRRLPWLTPTASQGFRFGELQIDPGRLCIVFPDGRETALALRELRLLELLHQRCGYAVTRDELYDHGWGRSHLPNSRALDQYMVGLRQKLGDDGGVLIESVRGVGYRYQDLTGV